MAMTSKHVRPPLFTPTLQTAALVGVSFAAVSANAAAIADLRRAFGFRQPIQRRLKLIFVKWLGRQHSVGFGPRVAHCLAQGPDGLACCFDIATHQRLPLGGQLTGKTIRPMSSPGGRRGGDARPRRQGRR